MYTHTQGNNACAAFLKDRKEIRELERVIYWGTCQFLRVGSLIVSSRKISPAGGELHIQAAAVASHHCMAAGTPGLPHMTGVPHTAADAVEPDHNPAVLAGAAHTAAGAAHTAAGVAHTAAGVAHTVAGVARSLVVGVAGRSLAGAGFDRSLAAVVRRVAVDCTCAIYSQCEYSRFGGPPGHAGTEPVGKKVAMSESNCVPSSNYCPYTAATSPWDWHFYRFFFRDYLLAS